MKNVRKLLNPALLIAAVMCCFLFLSSCADVQPQIKERVTGHQYGFGGSLWHGIVAPNLI